MQECELHRQADHFCPFGVMPAKDRANRAKGKKTTTLDSYEMSFDSGPLISGSPCISLCIAQSFFSPPLAIFMSVLLIPPNLPFTHIRLSTSLSTLRHDGSVPAAPSSHEDPRAVWQWSSSLHSARLTEQSVSDCGSLEEASNSPGWVENISPGGSLCHAANCEVIYRPS